MVKAALMYTALNLRIKKGAIKIFSFNKTNFLFFNIGPGSAAKKNALHTTNTNTNNKTTNTPIFDRYLKDAHTSSKQSVVFSDTSANKTKKSIDSDVDGLFSREEYEKYCSFITDGKGNTLVYFPPENASESAKKAWIEAAKQLTPGERFRATSPIMTTISLRFRTSKDYDAMSDYLSNISYQDIFKQSIENNKTNSSNQAQEYVKSLELILNSFIKYDVK